MQYSYYAVITVDCLKMQYSVSVLYIFYVMNIVLYCRYQYIVHEVRFLLVSG